MELIFAGDTVRLSSSTLVILSVGEWSLFIQTIKKAVHPSDFFVPEDLTKPLAIAQIRSLQQFAVTSPIGATKIAVLPLADQWKAEAGNALLKLLEEPPAYLYLVLLAETNHLLPTLRSRLREVWLRKDSATMGVWQTAFERFDVSKPVQRQKAKRLLYLQALTHSGIKTEAVIESFK